MPKNRALMMAACAVLVAPVPAVATDDRAAELAERLNDPVTQYAVAGMLSGLVRMVMDLDIEPLLGAAETVGGAYARDLPPDARLGDLVGEDGQRLSDAIAARVPAAMARMGTMTSAVAAMLPELEAMARRARDAVPTP